MAALIGEGPKNITINHTLYKDGFFNTLCLPFDLATLDGTPLENGELYELAESQIEDESIAMRLSKVTSLIAGNPYLIRWTDGSDITTPMTFSNVTVKVSEGTKITSDVVDFVGSIGRTTLPAGDEDYLFVGSGNILYYSETDDASSMKGFRAYFILKSSAKAVLPQHAPARLIIPAQTPTAAENVRNDNVQTSKLVENGSLYILKDGVKYNVQGQMVK